MSTPAGGAPAPQGSSTTQRRFTPGPGLIVVGAGVLLVIVLALAAAVTASLGAKGASAVLGGIALVILGTGLIAWLRVPARSLVVNAPRLRLERNRARAAQRRRSEQAAADGAAGAAADGRGRGARRAAARPGTDLARPVLGTDLSLPPSGGRRELTTRDVVTGPVSTLLASTRLGVAADERLAGTSAGEGIMRVLQLLGGCVGFVLVALGLASVLGQVIR
ncbi:hypothetical protein [Actinomyces radicidentis]|uniref:hypothetical protein n=1 Tax=Actinomyces radicidentis TaxID=111015 RepID=UPI0028EB2B5E|nr:hypothetical protein [Actinomyces radicidentis]